MKKQKRAAWLCTLLIPVLVGAAVFGTSVYADGPARKNNIKSKGVINYGDGRVVMDSADLIYLADEIDGIESSYKENTVAALGDIGTYYKADGSITHSPEEAGISKDNAANLDFLAIYDGIRQSQSVAHLADIQPAAAENLSSGTAAWVNGSLIIGNGADNNARYEEGYEKGKASGTLTLTDLEFRASRSVISTDSTQDLIASSSAKFQFNTENFNTLSVGDISISKANLSVSVPSLKVTYGGETKTLKTGDVIDISGASSITITASFDPRGHVSETASAKINVSFIALS